MRVVRLKLANVRTIEAAEFHFRPGFNLIAGVNGVGKTTVLDALAVCLSAIVRRARGLRRNAVSFGTDDIRMGVGALQLECGFELGGEIETYTLHRPRESVVVPREMDEFNRGETGHTANTSPKFEEFYPGMPVEGETRPSERRPLAVLFSTNRAVPSKRAPKKSATPGGVNAAYSDALSNRRELRLAEFAAWMRVQEALGSDRPAAKRVLAAFRGGGEALSPRVPEFSRGGRRQAREPAPHRPRRRDPADPVALGRRAGRAGAGSRPDPAAGAGEPGDRRPRRRGRGGRADRRNRVASPSEMAAANCREPDRDVPKLPVHRHDLIRLR